MSNSTKPEDDLIQIVAAQWNRTCCL